MADKHEKKVADEKHATKAAPKKEVKPKVEQKPVHKAAVQKAKPKVVIKPVHKVATHEAKPKAEHKPEQKPEHKAVDLKAKAKPKVEHKPAVAADASARKVNVYGLDGEAKGKVALPKAFETQLREDLIRAAVVRAQANRRQAYGPHPRSGSRHSVETWGKGHGSARVQRVKGERRGAQSPNNVSGRRAHPPRLDRVWERKMNSKEKRLARMSALGATKDAIIVKARGHRFKEELTLPVVIEESFERMFEETEDGYTRTMIEMLEKLGVYDDVVRAREGRHMRAGRGKLRGRRFRTPSSLLIVVEDIENVRRFFRNLPGVEVVNPELLSTERLAPGGDPGRLTVISVQALERMRGW